MGLGQLRFSFLSLFDMNGLGSKQKKLLDLDTTGFE
jgi:hypothetical protein